MKGQKMYKNLLLNSISKQFLLNLKLFYILQILLESKFFKTTFLS